MKKGRKHGKIRRLRAITPIHLTIFAPLEFLYLFSR